MASGDFKDRLLAGLGGDWPQPGPLNPKIMGEEQLQRVRRIHLTYEAEPGDAVNAYLLIPDVASANKPAPGVCVWHQHNGAWHMGAAEPAGMRGMEMHHTGLALAREGYVVLCPDALGFGEREKGYKLKVAASSVSDSSST